MSKSIRMPLSPAIITMRVCDELRLAGGSALTLNHVHMAAYLFEALKTTEHEGLELQAVQKNIGFSHPSTSLRIIYALGNDTSLARGSLCLGWFDIQKNLMDKRIKNIRLAPEGATVRERIYGIGINDEPRVRQIETDISNVLAASVTHHTLEADVGKFSWITFKEDKWGETEDKPIPLQESR